MSEAQFIETIIGVGILLFAAKLMAELFLRLKYNSLTMFPPDRR